jgi:hypothetical protein
MPITVPSYIASASVVGAPIKYKWNGDIAMEIGDAENDRLYDAIDSVNFKAKFAVGVVLTEWIVWRLQGHADIADALLRVEAAWAGVAHPAYMRGLEFEGDADDDTEKAQAPLEFAMANLGDIAADYAGGDIYLAESVLRQALLARHLMPDKKAFETWLTTTLKAAVKLVPRGDEYDEDSEHYDASDEDPVPREFFEPGFKYTPAAARKAVGDYLQSLDPAANPYLQQAKQLAKGGFSGTPYKLD